MVTGVAFNVVDSVTLVSVVEAGGGVVDEVVVDSSLDVVDDWPQAEKTTAAETTNNACNSFIATVFNTYIIDKHFVPQKENAVSFNEMAFY